MQQKIVGIIPARFHSTRFPGKPLVKIQGKPMIQLVYEAVTSSGLFDKVVVATDSREIEDTTIGFGGEVMMTKDSHQSGTDRCSEALEKLELLGEKFDIVVNVQGDEPFIKKEQIAALLKGISRKGVQICTLAKEITDKESIQNPSVVKVVKSTSGKALYFSRSPIPFERNKANHFYKHIGIYAFKAEIVHAVCKLSTSDLEKTESLEQLRWLENDYTIQIEETNYESIGIDTPEDLLKI